MAMELDPHPSILTIISIIIIHPTQTNTGYNRVFVII